jgi:hypothetical protein
MSCPNCTNGIIRSLGRDNDEIIEDCPDCTLPTKMNNLEALTIVRNCALVSAQMRTKQGVAALRVVDRKIQSLMRKKAWREGGGATPVHMGADDFKYALPEDAATAALRVAEAMLQAWLEHAREGDMQENALQTMDALTQIRAVLPPKDAPKQVSSGV